MTEREFNRLKAGDKVKHKGVPYVHTIAVVEIDEEFARVYPGEQPLRFAYFSLKRRGVITNMMLPPAKEHYTNWELVEVAA